MGNAIEVQLQKILNTVSIEEKMRNRGLARQTARLVRAYLVMNAAVSSSKVRNQNKG